MYCWLSNANNTSKLLKKKINVKKKELKRKEQEGTLFSKAIKNRQKLSDICAQIYLKLTLFYFNVWDKESLLLYVYLFKSVYLYLLFSLGYIISSCTLKVFGGNVNKSFLFDLWRYVAFITLLSVSFVLGNSRTHNHSSSFMTLSQCTAWSRDWTYNSHGTRWALPDVTHRNKNNIHKWIV